MIRTTSVHDVVGNLLRLQTPQGGFLASSADDRFCLVYPRDCVFVCNALLQMGRFQQVRKCYDFLLSVQDKSGEWKQRYQPTGEPAVTRPLETDTVGLVLHGLKQYADHTKDTQFIVKMMPHVMTAMDYIIHMSENYLVYGEHSVYEFEPLEKGHELWTNCWVWRGLTDAIDLMSTIGYTTASELYLKRANELRKRILDYFWDDRLGLFAKVLRTNEKVMSFDVSILVPLWTGVIDVNDKRAHRTVQFLDAFLWDEKIGGHLRYRKWLDVQDWHWYDGGYGPFVYWTLMMSKSLRQLGYMKQAQRAWDWVESVRRDGLLPEHVSTTKEFEEWKQSEKDNNRRILAGIKKAEAHKYTLDYNDVVYWAYPLGWSHAEYVTTYLDRLSSLI